MIGGLCPFCFGDWGSSMENWRLALIFDMKLDLLVNYDMGLMLMLLRPLRGSEEGADPQTLKSRWYSQPQLY